MCSADIAVVPAREMELRGEGRRWGKCVGASELLIAVLPAQLAASATAEPCRHSCVLLCLVPWKSNII